MGCLFAARRCLTGLHDEAGKICLNGSYTRVLLLTTNVQPCCGRCSSGALISSDVPSDLFEHDDLLAHPADHTQSGGRRTGGHVLYIDELCANCQHAHFIIRNSCSRSCDRARCAPMYVLQPSSRYGWSFRRGHLGILQFRLAQIRKQCLTPADLHLMSSAWYTGRFVHASCMPAGHLNLPE
jgi:hypothetical protein